MHAEAMMYKVIIMRHLLRIPSALSDTAFHNLYIEQPGGNYVVTDMAAHPRTASNCAITFS